MATQNKSSKNAAVALLASIQPDRVDASNGAISLHLDGPTAFYLYDFLSDVYVCLTHHPQFETAQFFALHDSKFTASAFEDEVMPMMAQINHALLGGAMAFTVSTNSASRRWLHCVRQFQIEMFSPSALDATKSL
jgi:hypothetical protein